MTRSLDQFARGRYSKLPGLWRLVPHRHYYTMTVTTILPEGGHEHGYQCMRCWKTPDTETTR